MKKRPEQEMVCANCGKELLEAAAFCIYCGSPAVPLAGEFGRVPLKPGKGYGIRSVFWGTIGWLAAFASHLIPVWKDSFADLCQNGPLDMVTACLSIISLPCIIASVVYGILGRNTEGRFYASIGLVLSALYCLPLVVIILFIVLDGDGYW